MLKKMVFAVLSTFCLTATLFTVIPVGSIGGSRYNPWFDYNDDGKIDVRDVAAVCAAFGSKGTNITKGYQCYDSGWLSIPNPPINAGQNYTLVHNLNLSSTDDIIVDARGLTPLWNYTYGGVGNDEAFSIIQASDGGYAIAGYTTSFGSDGPDFWLVKVDSTGKTQWNASYGGVDDDEAHCVIETGNGGYLLAGYTTSFGAGLSDFWLVNTDSSGIVQWSKTYGGTGDDRAQCVVQTDDGGYAVVGYTYSYGAGGADGWLIKTDADGNPLWNTTYGGSWDDILFSVIQTSDGGYALAGVGVWNLGRWSNAWLVKTDDSGQLQWERDFGGQWEDVFLSVVQTNDGGYALAGYSDSFTFEGYYAYYQFYLVKTYADGTMQWQKAYGRGQPYHDYAYSVVQTSDGGYAVVGKGFANLVKTDANGDLLWYRGCAMTGEKSALSVVQTMDGGYAMAGYAQSAVGDYDFWLVKTDSAGNTEWPTGFSCYGLAWTHCSPDSIALYRGATDPLWNFVRIQVWKRR
jgi:predicted secreted protein